MTRLLAAVIKHLLYYVHEYIYNIY